MSEHIEFNYASANSGGADFTTTPELIASVDAHLARWQVANNTPRVYFERCAGGDYKAVYGDDVAFFPLVLLALNAIETAALS